MIGMERKGIRYGYLITFYKFLCSSPKIKKNNNKSAVSYKENERALLYNV